MAKTPKKDTASVLAFEKKLVPSDGLMYGTLWQSREDDKTRRPLALHEKSVRGTISNRLKAATANDPLKLDAEVEKPNLQTVDHCALGPDQDTLVLEFTLKILSGVEQPSACNNAVFNKNYSAAAHRYIETDGFAELARRYAANIANGRFLWRNRVGAENIEVRVRRLDDESNKEWRFDATGISIRDFDHEDENMKTLAEIIAAALAGKAPFALLEITAFAQVGKMQDIYPSEELVLDKGNAKSKKSKILYSVDTIAAMHSQKIGNALRTIDTWYPAHDDPDESVGPIAIEPYGSVTSLGRAYRNPKDKADFYSLFDRFARGEELERQQDRHYVMAVLVRGGVFGEKA